MQRGEERYAPDYLQRVLAEFELGDADVQRQQSVEQMESDERLKPQHVEKQLSRRKSEIDSLEREADSLLEKAMKIRERLESRQEEDEFLENKRDNAIDTDDWERAMTLLNRYEEIIVKMGLEKEAALVTMLDLEELVDEQLRMQTGTEYLEQAEKITSLQQEFNKQQAELQREFNRQQVEKLVSVVESVREQQVAVNEVLEIVSRLQEQVADGSELGDRLAALRAEVESLEETLQSGGSSESETGSGLSTVEQRIVSWLEDDPELSDAELAELVGGSVSEERVSQLRDGLTGRGLVPPRPDTEE